MLVVRVGATVAAPCVTVAFPCATFTYAGGALHSFDDKPALVCDPINKMLQCAVVDYRIDGPRCTEPRDWLSCDLSFKWGTSFVAEDPPDWERRWYDRGELHRDFGPAIASEYASPRKQLAYWDRTSSYWFKYHRGKLFAAPSNTFGDGEVALNFVPGASALASVAVEYHNSSTRVRRVVQTAGEQCVFYRQADTYLGAELNSETTANIGIADFIDLCGIDDFDVNSTLELFVRSGDAFEGASSRAVLHKCVAPTLSGELFKGVWAYDLLPE
jgi:hypothetical protein